MALVHCAFFVSASGTSGDNRRFKKSETTALGLMEALDVTLRHDPNIALVESRSEASLGAQLSSSGRFDPVLDADLTQIELETPESETTNGESSILRGGLSMTQQLRSGLSLTPVLDLERIDDGVGTVNTATISFAVRQPLLRGRGRQVVAAEELAADKEVEASRLDLDHRIAERLLTVATRYWGVKAAMLDLEVLRRTEESSCELLATTRRLIAADVTPAAEIVQLEADLASKEADRIAGERTLFQTRQDLGREMGLEPWEIVGLALPGDPFPVVEARAVPLPRESRHLIDKALEQRADLAAARERSEAAAVRLHAAEDPLKPRLDLVVTPSYSGLSEGAGTGDFFSPIFDNVPGLSVFWGLEMSWPIRNRRAEGDSIQARAALEQSDFIVALVANAIGAEVLSALEAVRQNALQLASIVRAVALFEKAVDNEEKKLRAGTSTLIDVITQRDRLTSAQRRQVSAQRALAVALAELRFETGALLKAGTDTHSTNYENLTTLPF